MMILVLGLLFILILRAKNEKGAGFRQRNSFLLQLQVGHWSGPRADGNFRLYLLIISYSLGEISSKYSLISAVLETEEEFLSFLLYMRRPLGYLESH